MLTPPERNERAALIAREMLGIGDHGKASGESRDDWREPNGPEDRLTLLACDEPEPEISSKPKLPLGFSFSDRGLMWQNPDDMDKPAILIAGHFDVVAETRDADGTSWGVLLEWRDHD